MREWRHAPALLRAAAVAIAVAAAVDPAATSMRASKPLISVVAVDPPTDSTLAARVARGLADRFTVIPAPFPADATVLVGDAPPRDIRELSLPVFAVRPAAGGPSVTFESVRAPATAPFEARVPVVATLHVTGGRGRTVEVRLRSDSLVVDRATRAIQRDDERIAVALGFLPPAVGAATLHTEASVSGTPAAAHADASVNVRDTRWSVFFYDPRPSYMSTFVRRAVERDRRFVVTSRVVTSRNVSTDAGQPPAKLDDTEALSHFDALVLGAPESLTESDVTAVETYLRRRGGSVVLLLDQRAPGPYERLVDTPVWSTKSVGAGIAIAPVATDSAALRASEIAWPVAIPAGAEVLARALPTAGDSARNRAVLWQTSVGAGRIVVSGALDAWRFRDRSQSDFDRFWQNQVADAASASPPPIAIATSAGMLAPDEEIDVAVTLRRAALNADALTMPGSKPVVATIAAAIVGPGGSAEQRVPLRLWPAGAVGQLHAVLRAPAAAGTYRLVASADGATAETPIVVAPGARRARPDAPDLFAAWIAARGGRVITNADPQVLAAGLVAALRPTRRPEVWHPMRSPWWMVPFTLALCGEWWLRRRRGLA